MNKIHEWVNSAGILAILILVLVGGQSAAFGASGTRFPNGLSTNSTSPVAGELQTTTLEVDSTASFESTATFTGDVTLNGGDDGLIITTTNSATSSIEVGCIQMYATSTASPWRLAFSSIASTTALYGGGTSDVAMMAQYGTCPR
jgi:hypothetical protein